MWRTPGVERAKVAGLRPGLMIRVGVSNGFFICGSCCSISFGGTCSNIVYYEKFSFTLSAGFFDTN